MTDLDMQLRALAEALTEDAPDPPALDELGVTVGPLPVRGHRQTNRVLVAAVVVIVIAALVGIVATDRLRSDSVQPASGEVCVRDPGFFVGPGGTTFGHLSRNNVSTGPDDIPGSPVVPDEIPDYVRVTCVDGDGVVGWVRKSDLLPQLFGESVASLSRGSANATAMCDADGTEVGTLQTSPRYAVFADDGETVVGHIYPPIGYVPLGEEPHGYPDRNGLRPCDGDVTALPTQPATGRAQLAWPNAVNRDVVYDTYFEWRSPGDASPVIGMANDYERAKYMTYADQARSMAAQSAKGKGKPYNPADLLPPLRDEAGRIVAYAPVNARLLTVDEVNDANFDLCALQVANAIKQQQALRQHPEMLPPSLTPAEHEAYLNRDPRQGIGC